MPLHLPFNFPYFYNNYNYQRPSRPYPNNQYYKNNPQTSNINQKNTKKTEDSDTNISSESSECFFELFGLKLHFDDVLIICILFFLYIEGVQDQELFLCLILLLLS